MRRLGDTQRHVIRSLFEHKGWYDGCGWHWNGYGNTRRMLDVLVRRGYVQVETRTMQPLRGNPYEYQHYALSTVGEETYRALWERAK